eukprot:Hpha_TRINITY_DN1628_c0_g1::TRINITY_DN1628_c0_g1_i1::g.48768::m.48768
MEYDGEALEGLLERYWGYGIVEWPPLELGFDNVLAPLDNAQAPPAPAPAPIPEVPQDDAMISDSESGPGSEAEDNDDGDIADAAGDQGYQWTQMDPRTLTLGLGSRPEGS